MSKFWFCLLWNENIIIIILIIKPNTNNDDHENDDDTHTQAKLTYKYINYFVYFPLICCCFN